MHKFAACVHLLQLLIVCTWLVSLFVNYSHIFLCFCHYTVVFVLSVLNIIHVLDLESVCLIPNYYTIIILHNVLLFACSIPYLLLLWIYGMWITYLITYHIINVNFLIDTTFKPQISLILQSCNMFHLADFPTRKQKFSLSNR